MICTRPLPSHPTVTHNQEKNTGWMVSMFVRQTGHILGSSLRAHSPQTQMWRQGRRSASRGPMHTTHIILSGRSHPPSPPSTSISPDPVSRRLHCAWASSTSLISSRLCLSRFHLNTKRDTSLLESQELSKLKLALNLINQT